MTKSKEKKAGWVLHRNLRWIAPILAFVALAAWAFASPIGAGPDDDYHLTSTWCALGGSPQCQTGDSPSSREVSAPLTEIACYARLPKESAACQESILDEWNSDTVETDRGNFGGEYPPVYYATMHLMAGPDLQVSALAMRLVNAAIFVALATLLAMLISPERRRTLLWGWLVTLIPLGVFLIPSNNPSGWAITGIGTAFVALVSWFEATGSRRWALGTLTLVGVLMASGARGDAAVYVAGAMLTATIMAGPWHEFRWATAWKWIWLPLLGVAISLFFFASAGQSGVAGVGFSSTASPPSQTDVALTGFALLANNLLMLPFLWSGVWGTWPLGWLDTGVPDLASWSAVSAFIVVAFIGLGQLNWRKAVSALGVLLVLIVLPLWVLNRSGNVIGDNLQPRYLLPLIVLFAFILLTMPPGRRFRLTRAQQFVVFGALAVANLVALQVNIRRYVTGKDAQGLNLDSGAEWWWQGFPIGPIWIWLIGAAAFIALLALLWRELQGGQPRLELNSSLGEAQLPSTDKAGSGSSS